MATTTVHPIDLHVGGRLRLRRIILGLSQQDLGSSVGVTFQQVQKYEKGLNRIGASRLYEFSKVLKTDIAYFFGDMEGENSAVPALHEQEDTPFRSETLAGETLAGNEKDVLLLIRYYKSVDDPQMRKKILSLVRGVAQLYGEEPGSEEEQTEAQETL